jgi:hypothetical protein
MANYFVLFDTECPSCTDVARRLQERGISDLEVRAQTDPAMVDLFSESGRRPPNKPCLVRINGDKLEVWSGITMRLRLARMLGFSNAVEIVSLLAMEAKAKATRRSDTASRLSRRSLLGGAAGGAGALVFGTAAPAMARPHRERAFALNNDAKQLVLASPAVRQAGRVWGASEPSEIVASTSASGETVAMIPHRGSINAFTFVSVDRPDDALGITIAPVPSGEGIRYYLASGTPLAEQVVVDGEVRASRLDAGTAPPGAEPEPLGVREFSACFVGCMGANVTPECAIACLNCLLGNSRIFSCPSCAVCAGPRGLECARNCRSLL